MTIVLGLLITLIHLLTYAFIVVLVGGVIPYGFLLIKEEINITLRNFREMREDNRSNRNRQRRQVRELEARWAQRMGVKTSG